MSNNRHPHTHMCNFLYDKGYLRYNPYVPSLETYTEPINPFQDFMYRKLNLILYGKSTSSPIMTLLIVYLKHQVAWTQTRGQEGTHIRSRKVLVDLLDNWFVSVQIVSMTSFLLSSNFLRSMIELSFSSILP